MVRKDLERVGIAYRTDEGIADFHAAGRHSYVTGLLSNGVDLAKACELARHSDVRMTMRYTHIGLNEQAKSLESLPIPRSSSKTPVSEWDGLGCHRETQTDDDRHNRESVKPETETTCDTKCHKSSVDGFNSQKRREGDSNPRSSCPDTTFPMLHNRPLCHLSERALHQVY